MLAETVGQFPLGTAGLIHTFDVVGPEFSVVLTGGPPKTKVPIQAWLFLTDATRPCARREVHASPNGVKTAGSAGTAGSGENLWWILGVAGGRSRVQWSGRRPGSREPLQCRRAKCASLLEDGLALAAAFRQPGADCASFLARAGRRVGSGPRRPARVIGPDLPCS
jgi:hypothetical protein